ncbi:hypothetical protein [Comamonas sp. 4034]|uniref:hypothetical protein n=1 Tax=Comamonas sp. 4034 TaxID=3156455 RepID=UPI003D1AB266
MLNFKYLKKFVAAAAVCAAPFAFSATIPTISCTSDPNLFNTGYNEATGTALPNGSLDPRWERGLGNTTGPASVASWSDVPVNYSASAWVTSPFGNAGWLGFAAGPGEFYYRMSFNLDATVVPSNFSLPMTYATDDLAMEIYVNGIPQSSHGMTFPRGGFSALSQLTLNDDWQAGLNTLVFRINNISSPSGFLAQMQPSKGVCAQAVVDVTKVSSTPTVAPLGSLSYTITVSNNTLVTANNVSVLDTPPAGVFSGTEWSCTGTGGAVCPAVSGTGGINHSGIDLPSGAMLTYSMTGQVIASPPASFINTVSVDPGTGICSGGAAAPCTAQAAVSSVGVIQITKTSDVSSLRPGETATFTITVSNPGNAGTTQIAVSDPLPAGFTEGTWTCSGTCGALSGILPLADTIDSLAPGGSAIYTVKAVGAASLPDQITNVATASPQSPQVCSDGSAPPCAAQVSIQGNNQPIDPNLKAVPTLGVWALMGLFALLSMLGIRSTRQS